MIITFYTIASYTEAICKKSKSHEFGRICMENSGKLLVIGQRMY